MKKSFKWKKTNFVTDLPKHAPIIRYLVAKSKAHEGEYFMHAAVFVQGMKPILINSFTLEFHDEYKQ
jgi:hypothetical protein